MEAELGMLYKRDSFLSNNIGQRVTRHTLQITITSCKPNKLHINFNKY